MRKYREANKIHIPNYKAESSTDEANSQKALKEEIESKSEKPKLIIDENIRDLKGMDRVKQIFAKYFTDGYRVSSHIDYERFQEYYFETYNEHTLIKERTLNTYLSDNASIRNGRAYFVAKNDNNEQKHNIKSNVNIPEDPEHLLKQKQGEHQIRRVTVQLSNEDAVVLDEDALIISKEGLTQKTHRITQQIQSKNKETKPRKTLLEKITAILKNRTCAQKLVELKGLYINVEGNSVRVGGDTYRHKETLKSMGFKWDSTSKKWVYSKKGKIGKKKNKKPPQFARNKLGGKGVKLLTGRR